MAQKDNYLLARLNCNNVNIDIKENRVTYPSKCFSGEQRHNHDYTPRGKFCDILLVR